MSSVERARVRMREKGVSMKAIFITAMLAGDLLAKQQRSRAPKATANQAPAGQSQVAATLHVYAYPNKQQSQDQQFKDETECFNSAQVQASPGSQDAQAAQQGQDASKAGQGAGVKGAAKGAAGGAAIGAIPADPGPAAGIGPVACPSPGPRPKNKPH